MSFNRTKHHRHSIRLKDYDYSQAGAYFVTLCAYQRQCWFGEIKSGHMHLNQIGKIVANEWLRTPEIRPDFQLGEWIIMPNHIHGIVIITEPFDGDKNVEDARNMMSASNAPLQQKPNSLSSFIAGFKSAVTKQINLLRHNRDLPIWQRNYYESIIRDEKSLAAIREYIINNSSRWQNDPDNPQNYQYSQELSLDLFF